MTQQKGKQLINQSLKGAEERTYKTVKKKNKINSDSQKEFVLFSPQINSFILKVILKNADRGKKVSFKKLKPRPSKQKRRECEKCQIKHNDTNHRPTINVLGTIC